MGVGESSDSDSETPDQPVEEAPSERRDRHEGIRADADARDERAEERDAVADRRDEAASLDSFLTGDGFAQQLRARRSAAQDRLDSRSDRHSAADDRDHLSDEGPRR